jgi:hypothetical protein
VVVDGEAEGIRWSGAAGLGGDEGAKPGTGCYLLMVPEKRLLAWSSKSLCVVNDQPIGNPKRKV